MTVFCLSDDQPADKSTYQPSEAEPQSWWLGQQHILYDYLWHQSRIIIVLLDRQRRILAANQGLSRLVGPEEVCAGRPLAELLSPESDVALADFPATPPQSRQLRLIFATPYASLATVECRVYATAQGFLILGENPQLSTNELLLKMATLTEELLNLNRELAQKNRELARANAIIARLSRTDPLTGLANQRALEERLPALLAAARRHHQPLAAVLADLDHFKKINDTYGHAAGNEVLRGFARLLQENCRQEDLPVRWGGEEFLIVLPNTNREGAYHFAVRVKKLLAAQVFPPLLEPVTASFGISEFQPDDDADSFFKRADQALYQAKNAGRNRIEIL